MNKRTVGILVLVVVIAFYAFATGFPFFHRFLYVLLFLLLIGSVWAWQNLRGIDVRVTRSADRGQVGSYLEGRVSIVNRTRLPKSWLEVADATGMSVDSGGRGLALVRDQTRTWRIETYLSRRGVFDAGKVQVVSQDPFGLFRLRRDFSDPHSYIVYPATEPLPDLDPRFAGLPSDSRVTRHFDQITTDVASLRPYRPGDAFRRIHWPYTARMNTPMVKEFDIGLAAQAWVVLDMDERAHFGVEADTVNNTEELAVTIAVSLANQFMELSLPVGFAANGDKRHMLRPDGSPEHMGRLMEVFADIRATGGVALPEFLSAVRPHVSHFNTVTVVTPSPDQAWVAALVDLRRTGVNVAAVVVDPASFGSARSVQGALDGASANLIPTYLVRRGDRLNDALSLPVNQESIIATTPYADPLPARAGAFVTETTGPTGTGGAAETGGRV